MRAYQLVVILLRKSRLLRFGVLKWTGVSPPLLQPSFVYELVSLLLRDFVREPFPVHTPIEPQMLVNKYRQGLMFRNHIFELHSHLVH